MRKVLSVCFIMAFGFAGIIQADSLEGLPTVTVTNGTIVDLTYNNIKYVVADGDLSLGTTSRWYIDPTTKVETLWAVGGPTPPATVTGTSDPKTADNAPKADNFFFTVGGASDISSIDGIDFQETIFPFRSNLFFVFERGGNDKGTIQAILANHQLGPALTLNANGAPYANTGVGVAGQNAFGYVVKTDIPVFGIRITASGHDCLSISAPTPANLIAVNPPDTGKNVPLNLTFEWTYSADADVAVDSYTIFMDTNAGLVNEPNLPSQPMLIDGTGKATGILPAGPSDRSASYSYSGLQRDQVYYWKIVANVREPNSVNPGVYDKPVVVYGPVWSFNSITTGPTVDAGDSFITWLQDGNRSFEPGATVIDSTNDLKSTLWSVVGAPIGSTVTFSNTGIANPTINLDTAGAYLLKLWADDLAGNVSEDLLEVIVYVDSCQAAKANPQGYTAPMYDFDGNCIVNIHDFALFAATWLQDKSATANIPYSMATASVPVVAFTWPTNGETISGIPTNPIGGGPINAVAYDMFDPTKTDGTRIVNVVFQLINSESQIVAEATENIAPYDWAALDTTQNADGIYTLRAIATGNTTPAYKSQVDISVTLDNTP